MYESKKVKNELRLIPDLPVIKVTPLTPRISIEFLGGIRKKIYKGDSLKDQMEEMRQMKRK